MGNHLGVTRPNNVSDTESGQILVNKEKCWKELNLAWFLNNHSYLTYQYYVGDKDTYQLAWLYVGENKYTTNNYKPQSIGESKNGSFMGNTMLHFNLYGDPLFAHLTLNKDINNLLWEKRTYNVQKWGYYGGRVIPLNVTDESIGDLDDELVKIKEFINSGKTNIKMSVQKSI